MTSSFSVNAMKMGGTTGIQDISELSGSLFPNPATNIATLKFNNPGDVYSLQVMDMAGRLVQLSEDITNDRVDIDVRTLDSGLYIVKLTGQSGTFSTRLMVQ